MNGIPGVSTIRSSSSGGLSFVWVDFDWGTDLVRARFDVLERLKAHPSPSAHDLGDADALFDVGEITPLDYLAVREELLDGELAEITWRRDLRLVKETLKGLADNDQT